MRPRGARARRADDPQLRARRRLRPAARVARRAARRRAVAGRDHERLAPGLRLPRPAARPARHSRARRGADLRPAAQDPHAARRRDRRRADGRGRPRSPTSCREGDFAFLYTIPTFQNPSGRTLSLERRRRLAELAAERKLLVLEDDPYGLVRYDGEPLPSVFELAGGEQVAYCSLLLEDGRSGRARRLVRAAGRARGRDRGARGLDLHLAAVPLAGDGARVPPARQLRAEPRACATASCASGATRCSTRSRASCPRTRAGRRPEGGYFVWVELPSGPALRRAARPRRRRRASPSSRAATSSPAGGGGERALRLAFSFVSPAEIARGRLSARRSRASGGAGGALAARAGSRRAGRPRARAGSARRARRRAVASTKCTATCFRFSSTKAIA